ncbi:hypothetical protein [Paenibacillus pinihumi]|uniref:hypothetical protein n=1 Tax=Paenibacillus pinihumi TaxID=669462 RepID=UPI000688F7A4|nr:hypothetical protein [Paenibacillus pinihumi]
MATHSRNSRLFLRKAWFYCSSGLIGMFVVPILSVISVGFTICAFIAVAGGVLRTFGVDWVRMGIANGYEIPKLLSLPAALLLSGVLLGIAWISFIGLRRYLKWVSFRERNDRLNRI